jgi:hypothetical protein
MWLLLRFSISLAFSIVRWMVNRSKEIGLRRCFNRVVSVSGSKVDRLSMAPGRGYSFRLVNFAVALVGKICVSYLPDRR